MKRPIQFLLVASALLAQAQAQTEIASWLPVSTAEPGGIKYASATTQPSADISVPEVIEAVADRVNNGTESNTTAPWTGSTRLQSFDETAYTSFRLNVADDAVISLSQFTYHFSAYGTASETFDVGLPTERDVESTIQIRLRSSVDDFAMDIGSFTSVPEDRVAGESLTGLPIEFDLTGVAGLDAVTGEVEFRIYFWEENPESPASVFMWTDLSPLGATFLGEVTDPTEIDPGDGPVVLDPLFENYPVPGSEAAPNRTEEPPAAVFVAEGLAEATTIRTGGQGVNPNPSSIWPGSVSSIGFDPNSYLQVSLTPAPGATISISQFNIPLFFPYTTFDGGGWESVIRTSLDNFADDIATETGEGTTSISFDLSGVDSLQNLAAPVTLRLYLWETNVLNVMNFDPFMWFDFAGSAESQSPAVQILGSTQLGTVTPPSIASARFVEGEGFVVEATGLTPGRTYGLYFSENLSGAFQTLGNPDTAEGTTMTFTDPEANLTTDPKAFYRIEEVVSQ